MPTVGKTAIGAAGWFTGGPPYEQVFGAYTLSEAATVTAIWIYTRNLGSGTNDLKLLIYDKSGANPNALVAVSEPQALGPHAAAWTRFPIVPSVLLAAADYFVGFDIAGTPTTDTEFAYDTSSNKRRYKSHTYTDGPIATFGTPDGTDSFEASIYFEYTPTVIPADTTRTGTSRSRLARRSLRRKTRKATASVARTISGLLLREPFSSLAAWTADSGWAIDATRPVFIAYPTPKVLLAGGAIGSTDGSGPREAHLVVRPNGPDGTPGRWWICYDAGDGNNNKVAGAWQAQIAYSDDRGLTWTKLGPINGVTHGTVDSRCMGGFVFLHSDGFYYLYILECDDDANGIPGGPFDDNIYKAPSIEGPYTWIRESPALGGVGTFDEKATCIGWIENIGGTWHYYNSSTSGSAVSDNPGWSVGHGTAATPDGPFTKDGSGGFLATATTSNTTTRAENPKKWWSRALNKYVLTANGLDSGGSAATTEAWYSDTQTDFRGADVYRRNLQRLVPLDGNHVTAPTAIGIPCPVADHFGRPLAEEDGTLGFHFDGDPVSNFNGVSGQHRGRKILQGVLEPAVSAVKYTAPDTTPRHIARALTHADFVAEFDLEFDSTTTTDTVAFMYRRSASSADDAGNGYAFFFDFDGAGTGYHRLKKLTGGTYSELANHADDFYVDIDGRNLASHGRIRIVVVGSQHRLYVGEKLVLNVIDSTYLAGTAIAFRAETSCWIRNLHVRNNGPVAITGCPAGATVNVRGASGVVAATMTADTNGIAAVTLPHAPYSEIEVAGTSCKVPDGIFGGDTFQYVN